MSFLTVFGFTSNPENRKAPALETTTFTTACNDNNDDSSLHVIPPTKPFGPLETTKMMI